MKKLLLAAAVLHLAFNSTAEILPMNPGESMIPRGSVNDWIVEGLDGTEAQIPSHFWATCMTFRHPTGEKKARAVISRDFDNLEVGDFDQFVWYSGNSGQKIFVTLTVTTDKGVVSAESGEISGSSVSSKTDIVVDLDGAKHIKRISLECVFAEKSREVTGVGSPRLILRNKKEFQAYLNYWKRFDNVKWEGILKSETYNPSYQLRYGMLFSQEDLDTWREKHAGERSSRSFPEPEKAITPGLANPRGWELERMIESGTGIRGLRTQVGYIAFQAILHQDKELMRLAARYLLSICTVESWSDLVYPDPVGRGSAVRAFRPSDISFEAAFALDCVGEMLTTRGYNYVLKNLMYKGFMPITHSFWGREFAFVSNQGPVFMRGKMASLLIAERHWERVAPYTDIAKGMLDEMTDYLFRDDGSYMESSSGYLSYTIFRLLPTYQNFAAMREMNLDDVIPKSLRNSGAFAQVISSTSKHPGRRIVPIGCSANMNMSAANLAFMALACPDSMWVNLFNRLDEEEIERAKKGMWPGTGITFSQQYEEIKKLKDVEPEPLVLLKYTGLASSRRDSTKILMIGDAKGVGKKDSEIGSFVLEYEGDIYAMDMPGRPAGIFLSAQYHNMLVALDEKGNPVNSIRQRDAEARDSMRPEATGNDVKFRSVIDASPSWAPEYFGKWVRTIDSPTPDELTVADEYTLGEKATGAAFVWVTFLPCELDGNTIIITGEYGSKCVITAPDNTEITLENFFPGAKTIEGMALPENHECTRIMIKKPGNAGDKGRMEVKVRLMKGQ